MSELDNVDRPGVVSRGRENKEHRSVIFLRGKSVNTIESDRILYPEVGSLLLAPVGACLCKRYICKERRRVLISEKNILQTDDDSITSASYSLACLISTNHPDVALKYSTAEKRIITFAHDKRCKDAKFNLQLAKSGFYIKHYDGEQDHPVNLACYRCPLTLKMMDKPFDPDREHARWYPTCPHVIKGMGTEFIHSVLEDTRKIQMEHADAVRLPPHSTDELDL